MLSDLEVAEQLAPVLDEILERDCALWMIFLQPTVSADDAAKFLNRGFSLTLDDFFRHIDAMPDDVASYARQILLPCESRTYLITNTYKTIKLANELRKCRVYCGFVKGHFIVDAREK